MPPKSTSVSSVGPDENEEIGGAALGCLVQREIRSARRKTPLVWEWLLFVIHNILLLADDLSSESLKESWQALFIYLNQFLQPSFSPNNAEVKSLQQHMVWSSAVQQVLRHSYRENRHRIWELFLSRSLRELFTVCTHSHTHTLQFTSLQLSWQSFYYWYYYPLKMLRGQLYPLPGCPSFINCKSGQLTLLGWGSMGRRSCLKRTAATTVLHRCTHGKWKHSAPHCRQLLSPVSASTTSDALEALPCFSPGNEMGLSSNRSANIRWIGRLFQVPPCPNFVPNQHCFKKWLWILARLQLALHRTGDRHSFMCLPEQSSTYTHLQVVSWTEQQKRCKCKAKLQLKYFFFSSATWSNTA